MLRKALTLGVTLLLAIPLATPVRAALAPFTGTITVGFVGGTQVEIASLSGNLDALPNGTLILPPLAFASAVTVSLADTYVTAVGFSATGLIGGTLAPTGTGFGGSVPLTGNMPFLLDGGLGLGNLSVPLNIGSLTSPTAFTSNTAGSVFVSLSLSFSPWTTAPTYLTGTVSGYATASPTVSGSRTTTPGNNVTINLVSPLQIFRLGSTGGPSQVRTIPGFATMRLEFTPEPTALVLQGVAIATALILGVRRLRS